MRRFLSRTWVARIGTLIIFLAMMAMLRLALIALRDTNDRVFALEVGLPVIAACIAYGFWHDRRNRY